MMWLKEIPMCVVNAHVAMLGPLMADESRASATVVGVGHAMRPGDWAHRQLSSWEKAARISGEPIAKGVPPGVGIKVVKRGKAPRNA